MKKFLTSGGIIALCAVTALLATGCKSVSERIAEKATETIVEKAAESSGENADVDIDSETGEFTIKTDGGEMSTSTKVPDQWPSDVTIYSGATVKGSFSTTTDGKFGGWVTLTSSDNADKVKTFYQTDLVAKGWTEESSSTSSSDGVASSLLSYSKGEQSLLITIGQDSTDTNLTAITLTVDKVQ